MAARKEVAGVPMEDQTQISFQDTTWLRSYYLGPETALDYFALSPFYDRSSNNEQCRMQGLDPMAAMRNMTGLEYVLAPLPPEGPPPAEGLPPQPRHLFVIKKQLRRSRINAEVQGVYYIMDGTIYQAPSALALIQSRLHKAAFLLGEAFQKLAQLPELNARGGWDWQWNREAVAAYEAQQREAERTDRAAARNEPRLAVDSILLQLVEKYSQQPAKAP